MYACASTEISCSTELDGKFYDFSELHHSHYWSVTDRHVHVCVHLVCHLCVLYCIYSCINLLVPCTLCLILHLFHSLHIIL